MKIWLARVLVLLVLVSNLIASASFLLDPEAYMGGFELNGAPGRVATMGVGLLFLMWQVPYLFALIHPIKNWISLIEATLMQAIGLAGETWILSQVSMEHAVIRESFLRFIWFDLAGLVCLAFAIIILSSEKVRRSNA